MLPSACVHLALARLTSQMILLIRPLTFSTEALDFKDRCHGCNAQGVPLITCKRCRLVRYCVSIGDFLQTLR